ncbi:hypothetical protein Q9295_16605 [Xinfangfangia sp. CPCC 101601]|uniref:Uncharacterized protein n=1 Tax=Pseudogemmobacter lacusdianii TaxID=3069608 RepID=A0ABU0W1Z3_9RHOB|nr:hypothetical protein [Xinfangfangia sp. CPCC 101601]MDQ2067997.1 hypothetical protein [Xinfangfangia sp. CPCC 101601]
MSNPSDARTTETAALEARLFQIAAAGQTIPYGALARDLGWRMATLTAALEALMEADSAAQRPLRASLCEGKLSRGQPALGFFEKAAALGYDISDPEAFVAAERAALFGA